MTRTIQTALAAFASLLEDPTPNVEVQIWPDLREAHEAICNQGSPRAEMENKYPQLDFSRCLEQWTYEPYTVEAATERAERVRQELKLLGAKYKSIAVVTHYFFIGFLVQGRKFETWETRSYRFAKGEEVEKLRFNTFMDDPGMDPTRIHDFGPSVLLPCEINDLSASTSAGF
ncbi:MAG: hypothetical protein M1827_003110 [Pycnora praestabilis]|nr:MAG: hypothetical protein M1827_003110 [Pycnora praestabilis]